MVESPFEYTAEQQFREEQAEHLAPGTPAGAAPRDEAQAEVAALRAELARAGTSEPDLIERDRLWCRALTESRLTPFQIEQVTARFLHLRADAERPPQETTDADVS